MGHEQGPVGELVKDCTSYTVLHIVECERACTLAQGRRQESLAGSQSNDSMFTAKRAGVEKLPFQVLLSDNDNTAGV